MSSRDAGHGSRTSQCVRWAVLAVALAMLAVAAPLALGASPGPGGDPRSAGEGPGFAGDPGTAIVLVLVLGLGAALVTTLYVRVTGGRRTERPSDHLGADPVAGRPDDPI